MQTTDQPLRFTIPSRHVRGRFVRLEGVLQDILSAHDYPGPVKLLLAEAITLGALMGSLLKDADGQLTMQAQTEGGCVELLVVDYRDGELRGHARFAADKLATMGPHPSLFGLFGKGFLALTFDQRVPGPDGNARYQGIVPLDGASLTEACQNYFFQSEQIPTLIRVSVESTPYGCRSAGFLVQHLPDGEEGRERLHVRLDHPEWEHVEILASSITEEEMLDRELPARDLVWRLFHEEEEVRVEDGTALVKGCRCNVNHIRDVLAKFPAEERKEMANDTGMILVDCAFCSKAFEIAP